MEITQGKIKKAQRVVIYGPEGIGKSTFASAFPNPLFVDIEGGTNHLDVNRTPHADSWAMLKSVLAEFTVDQMGYKTIVIDTIDWAERLCIEEVCAANGLDSLGGANDYGKSYNLLYTNFGKMLNFLSGIVDQGVHVVLLAHAGTRKFELPDEAGAYDKYELKLEKKVSPVVKEWADLVLFANYKTIVVEVDNKKKAQGGKRVMYTSHHPCWDAKNRHDLKAMLDFKYEEVAHCFPDIDGGVTPITVVEDKIDVEKATVKEDVIPGLDATDKKIENESKGPIEETATTDVIAFHAQLYTMMTRDNITRDELQQAVSKNGYYPANTPMDNYEESFVKGHLLANWEKVIEAIKGK